MNNGFCASSWGRSCHAERQRGFTLIELMVVIALMTVLLVMALPSFSGLIEKYRVEGMASALMASVSHARSEAARRGKTVTIQARAGCSGRDWSCGWDTVVGSGAASETLKRQDPDTRVAVQKGTLGGISFDAMGHSAGVAGFSFHPVGSDGSSSNAVAVCLALGGRVRLVKGGRGC
ncbi:MULTISPECIES: GspH/FimT family pseudopilin [unclassified Variovorax]|uniref:GspH/FimT family pseudopilin n=1 Tax=unclassified Variovorax TaxID=663243 RepID=UPI003F46058A